jgi:sortase A
MRKLGLLFIVAGIVVMLIVPVTWMWGWIERRGLSDEFDKSTADASLVNQAVLDKLKDKGDQEKLKAMAVSFQATLVDEQPVARLEIPRIGVSTIVVEGTDRGSLLKGPGHIKGTPIPGMQGNFAVAGDRVLYGAPFLKLNDLENGDEIFVTTPYGKFTYAVIDKHLTLPEDVSVLQSNGKEEITLITCDPPWDTSHRLIVRGSCTSASLLNVNGDVP